MNNLAYIDDLLTANRREQKYLATVDQARAIKQGLGRYLKPHRFTGPGANPTPGGSHFTTTVYFDTARSELYATAKTSRGSLKVRAREYYDEHITLAQGKPQPTVLKYASPILWVELKESARSGSGKRRVGIPKRDIAQFFSSGRIDADMLEVQRRAHREASRSVLTDLQRVCERFSTALRPSAIVNYRRAAWQDARDQLRVTIDHDVTFFAPQAGMWAQPHGLERRSLGEPFGVVPHCVIEVKTLRRVPNWLERLMAKHIGPPVRFSKFIAASEGVAFPALRSCGGE